MKYTDLSTAKHHVNGPACLARCSDGGRFVHVLKRLAQVSVCRRPLSMIIIAEIIRITQESETFLAHLSTCFGSLCTRKVLPINACLDSKRARKKRFRSEVLERGFRALQARNADPGQRCIAHFDGRRQLGQMQKILKGIYRPLYVYDYVQQARSGKVMSL